MTDKKNLKKRVRERQEKTGERYSTALAHLRAQAREEEPVSPSANTAPKQRIKIEEPWDPAVTREAGLQCPVFADEGLKARTAPLVPTALFQLAEVLRATSTHPSTQHFRRMVLHGERYSLPLGPELFTEIMEFGAQLRLGMRGASASGRYLAFDVTLPGRSPVLVVALLMTSPVQAAVFLIDGDVWPKATAELNDPSWVRNVVRRMGL